MDAALNADSELLERLKDGDVRSAGALLVTRFADEVYALCRAMVRDPVEAEDLSQDVFGRAFASLRTFRGDASPRTWILRIARNRCIDHMRAQKRSITEEEEEPDDHPAEAPLAIDSLLWRTDVEHALGVLNENERALVVLRFGNGLGYPQLADAFGLREGTVRMRLSRAVAKMREAVSSLRSEESARISPVPPLGAPAPMSARAPSRPAAAPASRSAAPMKRATDSQELAAASASPLRFSAPKTLREKLSAQASAL